MMTIYSVLPLNSLHLQSDFLARLINAKDPSQRNQAPQCTHWAQTTAHHSAYSLFFSICKVNKMTQCDNNTELQGKLSAYDKEDAQFLF